MKNLEGTAAPDFDLEGSDGKVHRLKDYKGRTIVLYFYPKDGTPGCTQEACSFRDLRREFEKLGVTVLGVSRDSLDAHRKFAESNQLPFVLLSDPEGKMLSAYGAWGEKKMYGKTVTGAIRSTVVIGPDGKVLRHWHPVKKAAQHPAEVLGFLKELAR